MRIASILMTLFFVNPAFSKTTTKSMVVEENTAKVYVKEMVCKNCKKKIATEFKNNELAKTHVKKIDFDLKKRIITLEFKKGKSLSKKQIQEIIKKAGFDA
ncbi:MAG: hypothetical protein CL678_05945 [Bdellovibrionaceae bacterium]|nr:hypothetical protein [Pseudobdellovibrionaceae bacterium]|tara:strand:- start:276 stop:578 length:303 start_codon:yes stop_codon:yes gene_type:complete